MKRYEKESLFKNFLVFFSLLEILLVFLFLELYHTEKRDYKQELYRTMQVCSYTLKCEQFTFDFAKSDTHKLNKLYDDNGLYSYFVIPKSEKFYIKISYPLQKLIYDIRTIQHHFMLIFSLATLLLFLLSLFFTFYSLKPIRKALQLNDEFIKDILHDFNTPITSMILNIKMCKEEIEKEPFIQRISHSIDNILLLQNNLKSFLHHSPSQNKEIDITVLTQQRVSFIQHIYPKISFYFKSHNHLIKYTNEEFLIRILDNILSNAAKYNKPKGRVTIEIIEQTIHIQDTGKGIQNIDKIFDRYYKEQDRGLGLGLHIVKKFTEELHIDMTVNSRVGKGTYFILNLSKMEEYP